MKKFEIGKTYNMRSACDSACVWSYKVTKRTAQTVTLEDENGKTMTCRINNQISAWNNAETVHPLGRYSMAPALRA